MSENEDRAQYYRNGYDHGWSSAVSRLRELVAGLPGPKQDYDRLVGAPLTLGDKLGENVVIRGENVAIDRTFERYSNFERRIREIEKVTGILQKAIQEFGIATSTMHERVSKLEATSQSQRGHVADLERIDKRFAIVDANSSANVRRIQALEAGPSAAQLVECLQGHKAVLDKLEGSSRAHQERIQGCENFQGKFAGELGRFANELVSLDRHVVENRSNMAKLVRQLDALEKRLHEFGPDPRIHGLEQLTGILQKAIQEFGVRLTTCEENSGTAAESLFEEMKRHVRVEREPAQQAQHDWYASSMKAYARDSAAKLGRAAGAAAVDGLALLRPHPDDPYEKEAQRAVERELDAHIEEQIRKGEAADQDKALVAHCEKLERRAALAQSLNVYKTQADVAYSADPVPAPDKPYGPA